MGDDRFSYLDVADTLANHLMDEEDEKLGWDLPDDDIRVPAHLLPPYQDEDDETILPSASHPSYPYGNPYAPRITTTSYQYLRSAGVGGGPSSSAQTLQQYQYASHTVPTTLFRLSSHSKSLRTSLPNLELRELFEVTTLGEAKDRTWNEMGLGEILKEREMEEANNGLANQQAGDAPAPAGQNSGDHPVEEEEDDDDDEEQAAMETIE